MADNDIYNSKQKYEYYIDHLDEYLTPPRGLRYYQIKHPPNMRYFQKLIARFEAKDLSYIRRLRLMRTFLLVCNYVQTDLAELDRDAVDILLMHTNRHNKSDKSKTGFIVDIKNIWKIILPERDEKGRIDDSIVPYAVRHLSCKIDKSRQKVRKDRIDHDEYERIIAAFAHDPRMQALLSVMFESLGRPQEIMGRNLSDVEIFENYASITISEHGKEGVGILRVIDSYFYLTKWLNIHPLKHDPSAPLFINMGQTNRYARMKPYSANKLLREHCARIGIHKPLTLYSFKRNGVTYCRLRGDSDVDIQHRARWTSTKQLQTYDLSNQRDSFRQELRKRGLIQNEEHLQAPPTLSRQCSFCHVHNGSGEQFCTTCKRPLDRKFLDTHKSEVDHLKEQLEAARLRDQIVLKLLQSLTDRGFLPEVVATLREEGLDTTLSSMMGKQWSAIRPRA